MSRTQRLYTMLVLLRCCFCPCRFRSCLFAAGDIFFSFSPPFTSRLNAILVACRVPTSIQATWADECLHFTDTALDCKILCGVLVGWLGGSICGVLFESKLNYRDGDYRIRYPFCLLPAILKNMFWGINIHLTLAHCMANGSRPKKIFRFSFVWGFLFQNERFATCEKSNRYCGM